MTQNQTSFSVLSMDSISKSFGATQALDRVDFDLKKGEVHALLGENGAGKSTLVKILSGALTLDRGTMVLEGSKYAPSSPLESRKRGVSMIYQELNLAPHLTVEENIMLGKEDHSWGWVRQKAMRAKVSRALEQIHHPEISLDIPVGKLSIGARQVVEIVRALTDEASVLVMDEPTSSLSQEDSQLLFQIIRKLKAQGVSIIYISHFLEEVQRVADRFTVLRDGKRIRTGHISKVSLGELVQYMVGQKIKEIYPKIGHEVSDIVLSLDGLKGRNMQKGVSLDLHRGEILGVAGLIGSGRTELLRTIFGLDAVETGKVKVAFWEQGRATPWTRIRQGMGLMSEDRQGEGLALSLPLADNLTLSDFSPYTRHGIIQMRRWREAAAGWISKVKIKAQSPVQTVYSLSGGNQQKVALARLLHQQADILLLDEPTRGIDVVSKSQIYGWIGRLASQGKGIIYVSSYFPELIGICDRIAVFHRGRIIDIREASHWNEEDMTAAAMTGQKD